MQVVVFSKLVKEKDLPFIQDLFDALFQEEVQAYVYKPFLEELDNRVKLKTDVGVFESYIDLSIKKFDFFITLGGDGNYIKSSLSY